MGAAVLVVLALGGLAAFVGGKVVDARTNLEAALPLVQTTEQQLLAGNGSAAAHTAALLQKKTSAARAATDGAAWKSIEWVPVIGPNLRAVRTLSDVVDGLAIHAVVPASTINLSAFQPVDGRLNPEAIQRLQSTVSGAKTSIDDAVHTVGGVSRRHLVPQVSAALTRLSASLHKVQGVIDGVDGVVKVLPGALGMDGPRHYLLMFQGNSEIRALGGNPAALALVTVDDGAATITKQLSSSNFYNGRPTSVAPLDPAVEHIYSNIIGRWLPNVTSTPNFPTTVDLLRAYWAEEDPTHIDGVISFDPVALSYLLEATGPIPLTTGQTLTAANAIPLLLNQVYSIYPDPMVQNAFFAATADSVFKTLMSGKGNTVGTLQALVRATDQGRLLFWSENPAEEKLVKNSRLSGILPSTNTSSTVVGAYFNDVTGSKMDYFVKARVAASSTQCSSTTPTFDTSVVLSNVITPSQVGSLPYYVTGPYYKPGRIATDVVVYGPVGSRFTSWKANGSVTLRSKGVISGRPVMRILVTLGPKTSMTLHYTLAGVKGSYGPLQVQTTPGVWPTPTTTSTPGCKPAAAG